MSHRPGGQVCTRPVLLQGAALVVCCDSPGRRPYTARCAPPFRAPAEAQRRRPRGSVKNHRRGSISGLQPQVLLRSALQVGAQPCNPGAHMLESMASTKVVVKHLTRSTVPLSRSRISSFYGTADIITKPAANVNISFRGNPHFSKSAGCTTLRRISFL